MSENMYNVHQKLGELQGLIRGLSDALKEDRRTRGDDWKDLTFTLDKIDDRLLTVEHQLGPIARINGENAADIGKLKLVYTKVAAVIGFFSTLGGILVAGLWWILTNWNEIFSAARQILGGWK